MARNATAYEISDPNDRQAGGYHFTRLQTDDGPPAGIVHNYPCGCGGRSALWFRGMGKGRAEWDVAGQWPKVTLAPSIGIYPMIDGKYHWHGFLENGEFVER